MDFSTIQRRIYRNTKTNSTNYPIQDLVDDVNVAYDRVESLILKADARWQFDDENYTDLPIATTGLVAGQQDYSLAVSHIDVTRVEIQNQAGTWHLLKPIDQSDVIHKALEEFKITADMPRYYDKIGNSIFLYPVPNFSRDAALKLWFKRGPSYFATSDTTKEPGFNQLFHDIIPLWVSYDYWMREDPSFANRFFTSIQAKEAALNDYYANRSPDRIVMRTSQEVLR